MHSAVDHCSSIVSRATSTMAPPRKYVKFALGWHAPFLPIPIYFQWNGPSTAVSPPGDRLWWLILHTTPLSGR